MNRRQTGRSPAARIRQTRLSSSLAAICLAAACGVLTLDEQLLQRFFEASRLYDMAAVEKVATVAFNPRIDGVVEEFTVAGVEATGDRRVADVDVVVRRGGRLAEERLRVTISRRDGRWLITDVRRLPASQTAPAASSAPPN